jgi:hypothetical protein
MPEDAERPAHANLVHGSGCSGAALIARLFDERFAFWEHDQELAIVRRDRASLAMLLNDLQWGWRIPKRGAINSGHR